MFSGQSQPSHLVLDESQGKRVAQRIDAKATDTLPKQLEQLPPLAHGSDLTEDVTGSGRIGQDGICPLAVIILRGSGLEKI